MVANEWGEWNFRFGSPDIRDIRVIRWPDPQHESGGEAFYLIGRCRRIKLGAVVAPAKAGQEKAFPHRS